MEYNKGDKFIFEILDGHTDVVGIENYYQIKEVPYISLTESVLDKLKKVEEEKYRPSELDKFRQEAFEKGMEEAWKIAGLIAKYEKDGGIGASALVKVFGCEWNKIFDNFTIKEVKEIIENHFPEKLSPPSFDVGDVVEKDGVRAIVLDFDGEYVSVWTENGCTEGWTIEKVTKTDAHCDLKPILEFIGNR